MMVSTWSRWYVIAACCMAAQPLGAQISDPTRPPTYRPPEEIAAPGIAEGEPQAEAPAWIVSSILISPARRIAVINGRTVREGDVLEAATVLEIGPAQVRLRLEEREFAVALVPKAVKMPVKQY